MPPESTPGNSCWPANGLGADCFARRHVSSVRRANAAGYRDLVQLARPNGDRLLAGPQGVLEGTGESLCRIKLIQTTESVSEGDLVLATGGEALLDAPLVYGRVVRIENRPGTRHWEIWMEPAARASRAKWPCYRFH